MQQLKKQQGNCLLKRHTRRSEFLQYYEGFVLVEEGTLPPRLLDAGKPEMLQQLLICSVLWGKSLSHLRSPVWNTKHSTNVTKLLPPLQTPTRNKAAQVQPPLQGPQQGSH